MPKIELTVTVDSYEYKYRLNDGQIEQLSNDGWGWFPLRMTRTNRPFLTKLIEVLRSVERMYS